MMADLSIVGGGRGGSLPKAFSYWPGFVLKGSFWWPCREYTAHSKAGAEAGRTVRR